MNEPELAPAPEVSPLPPPPPPPPPPESLKPTEVPVRATVGSAWRLLVASPRAVLLPSLVIQVPVAAVVAVLTTVLYFTRFSDEPFLLLSDIDSETDRGLAFALVAITAVQVLFGQVARAATVVSVAAAATGSPRSLADALDPAFTRMGAVISQAVVLAAIGAMLLVSVVGIFLFPYVAGRLAVSTESMMLEQQRPMSAIASSWRLMARRVTRLLGVLLLTVLICLGPLVVVSLLNLAVTGTRDQQVISSGAVTVAQAILVTPAVALLTAVVTLFYLKAREIDRGKRPA